MKDDFFVGIDTSNYTTSMAVCSRDGEILANLKQPLTVGHGERGLRQSEAVFQHTKNLEKMYERLIGVTDSLGTVLAVGASFAPRNAPDSYMPCFLVGKDAALGYAAGARVPAWMFSHQEGHVMAALYSASHPTAAAAGVADAEALLNAPMAAFHVSGGTTEMLLVEPKQAGFSIRKIGGTADLNAGQVIDRVGVAMGLDFPCGAAMERLAAENELPVPPRHICVKKRENVLCCFSGLENLALGLLAKTENRACVSAFVLDFIAETLDKMTDSLRRRDPNIPVLYAGGVMSNRRIQQKLSCRPNVWFSEPAFSADNAAGIALLCRRRYFMEANETEANACSLMKQSRK